LPASSFKNPSFAHAFALPGGVGQSAIRAARQLLKYLLCFGESPSIEFRHSVFK
jgi:hypothetical protein